MIAFKQDIKTAFCENDHYFNGMHYSHVEIKD